MTNVKKILKKDNFEEGYWEVILEECTECSYSEYYGEGVTSCPECSAGVEVEWNYDWVDCMICNNPLQLEEPIYVEKSGAYDETICECCYKKL